MIDLGFILLYRKFFNGKYWRQRRVFSKAEAFLSLLEKAQYKSHEVETYSEGTITVRRGEILTSLQSLSREWQWSVGKVSRFLKNDMDIEMKTERHFTMIYLINYDTYQTPFGENGIISEQKRKPNGNQTETKRKRTKKVKKDKESNVGETPPNYVYKIIEYWNDRSSEYLIEKKQDGKFNKSITGLIKTQVNKNGYEKIISILDVYFKIKDDVKYYYTNNSIMNVLSDGGIEKLDPVNNPFENLLVWELQKNKKGIKDVMQSEREGELKKQAQNEIDKTEEYLRKMKAEG